MNNQTSTIPENFFGDMPPVKSATFQYAIGKYATYAPEMDSIQFMDEFKGHTKIQAMLSSSGSSWEQNAYLFCQLDCFDPPQYVQFGSDFSDCFESFCDNDESLVIDDSALKDYDQDCLSYNSNGQPIDTESVHASGLLKLVSVSFL